LPSFFGDLEPITGFDLDEPIHNSIVHCTSQNRASKFHRAGRDWLPVLATMLGHLAKDGRQAIGERACNRS
jgi:hypothetical protein